MKSYSHRRKLNKIRKELEEEKKQQNAIEADEKIIESKQPIKFKAD